MATLKEALSSIKNSKIKHIVSLSGGKDSAALAIYLAQNYSQIPFEYVFCDTDNELPETYEYLERLEVLLGKKITKVNAFDVLNVKKKHGRNAFDFLLNELYGGYLPSPRARWCTRALKIKPFEHYVGNSTAYSYIGLRADENREGYQWKKPPMFSDKPNIIPVYPFRDDNIKLQGVKDILEKSGVGLPDYYKWRSRSGCYFCFYQQIGEWQGLKEKHPELYEKAKKFEKAEGKNKFTWVEGRTLDEISKIEKRYSIQELDESEGCAICHL